jgi:glycine cleavage system H protein
MSREINDLILPDDVRYSQDHEWACQQGDKVRIGITDYAQDQLGDIVFVEMPRVGDSFKRNEEFGSMESVKAVSEMFMPVGGEITAINEELEDVPELINQDPYGKGWIIEIKPADSIEMDALLDKNAYLEMLKGI